MSDDVNPGAPFSTRNPRMPSSARAHTIATSADVPLVIQGFSPFRIQSPPSRRAGVRVRGGLEPNVKQIPRNRDCRILDWKLGAKGLARRWLTMPAPSDGKICLHLIELASAAVR